MYNSPVARCLSIIADIGDLLLDAEVEVDTFLNEVNICSYHPDKILVLIGQEVHTASFFFSLKDPRHDPGVG